MSMPCSVHVQSRVSGLAYLVLCVRFPGRRQRGVLLGARHLLHVRRVSVATRRKRVRLHRAVCVFLFSTTVGRWRGGMCEENVPDFLVSYRVYEVRLVFCAVRG